MALKDISSLEVRKAINEFDRIGLWGMLRKYGGERSYRYFVEYRYRRYDQKLIVRAAHGFLPGERPLDVRGGGANATRTRIHLKRLGFKVFDCAEDQH